MTKSIVLDFIFLGAGFYFYEQLDFSRRFVVYYAILSFSLILGIRFCTQIYLDFLSPKGFNVNRILIVGDRKRGDYVWKTLEAQLSWGMRLPGGWNSEGE